MILGLILLGCSEVREPGVESTFNLIDSPPGVSVYFDRDVQSIFNRSCTGGCHEPGALVLNRLGWTLLRVLPIPSCWMRREAGTVRRS
jgi:hypothetical protein